MKQVVLAVSMLLLVLSGIALAEDQKQDHSGSTIVGPVMVNRYVYISPKDDQAKVQPETVKRLMDQGVIPAAEDARINAQGSGGQK